MMTVGDDAHCADAVTGNARTASADKPERTLVMFMTSNSNHTPQTPITPLPMISSWCGRDTERKLIE
jgi:hypothetical protein